MRFLTVITIVAAAMVGGSALVPVARAPAQPAPLCTQGESVTAFGEWFAPNVEVEPQARTAARLVPALSAAAVAVRLQVRASAPAGQRWSLVLRDPKQRILAILTERDFPTGATAQTQWTGRLEADQLSAELVGGGPGLRIGFAAGLALPRDSEGVNVFSTQTAQPNWADPYEQRSEQLYRRAAEAVGMLVTGAQTLDAQGVPRKQAWCCTGTMLTSDIYLTNWHCGGTTGLDEPAYWNDQVCANTVIDLGWHSGTPARRQYACEQVLRVNKRLDYALLRVRPIVGPGAATGRAPPVTVARELPTDGAVFMVHHAQCKPKLVSFSGCRIRDRSFRAWTDNPNVASGPDITHQCDTEPGASGAPVFDMGGRMIALHHLGFQRGGPQCPSDRLNKATTMASIEDDVAAAAPALSAELTRR